MRANAYYVRVVRSNKLAVKPCVAPTKSFQILYKHSMIGADLHAMAYVCLTCMLQSKFKAKPKAYSPRTYEGTYMTRPNPRRMFCYSDNCVGSLWKLIGYHSIAMCGYSYRTIDVMALSDDQVLQLHLSGFDENI